MIDTKSIEGHPALHLEMTMRRMTLLTAVATLSLGLTAPAFAHDCGGQTQASASQGARLTLTSMQPTSQGDIVDVATAAGSFQTLLAAATAAGLVDTLKSPGPFTVFAPTNAAFAALPAGTVESLLRPENREQLRAILLYHVVPGRIAAADLAGKTAAPVTAQGAILAVDGRTGVQVNDARVITADVAASNGVIHVIDRVLMPPTRTAAAAPARTGTPRH
jgi:uncharacterized surface protein with fasciclin (FAS1) repeats